MAGGRNSFSIDVDTMGLDAVLDQLGDDVEDAVRPASQAAAQVLYEEVLRNVNGIGRVTGNLAASIYQVYSVANSTDTRAVYQVSWNHRKAPHGHLLEYGYVRRYVTLRTTAGAWVTAVRPEARGKRPPGRRATQAEKDAYYVPLPGGPVQIPGRAFVRRAESAFDRAVEAAQQELLRRIGG